MTEYSQQLASGLWDFQVRRHQKRQQHLSRHQTRQRSNKNIDPRLLYKTCKAAFPRLFQAALDFAEHAKQVKAKNLGWVLGDLGDPKIIEKLLQRNFAGLIEHLKKEKRRQRR